MIERVLSKINEFEIAKRLKSLKKSKSMEPNQILPLILKECAKKFALKLYSWLWRFLRYLRGLLERQTVDTSHWKQIGNQSSSRFCFVQKLPQQLTWNTRFHHVESSGGPQFWWNLLGFCKPPVCSKENGIWCNWWDFKVDWGLPKTSKKAKGNSSPILV